MQYCRIISLDNNNSIKFTSLREDNPTTNDSMAMKIAHEQLYMNTNIMYKFQSSTRKTVGEKLRTKLCPRTDGWTDRRTDSHGNSCIPCPLRCAGYKKLKSLFLLAAPSVTLPHYHNIQKACFTKMFTEISTLNQTNNLFHAV